MNEREIIAKEWRDDNGILHRREVGRELIRCKDCKFNGIWCDIQDIQWSGYDKPVEWCSYGERREL